MDMILSGLGQEHTVDFSCCPELGFVVELRDLRGFLIWDRNLHFPEAEVIGRKVVKYRFSLFLDDILEQANRFFSVYFDRKRFCVRVTVDKAEESDGRRCPGMIEVR